MQASALASASGPDSPFCCMPMTQRSFAIDVHQGDIIVSLAEEGFRAVYYKPSDQPQLVLKHRTETDDYDLLAQARQAAKQKARELGWIA
jgi:hypothetical protein